MTILKVLIPPGVAAQGTGRRGRPARQYRAVLLRRGLTKLEPHRQASATRGCAVNVIRRRVVALALLAALGAGCSSAKPVSEHLSLSAPHVAAGQPIDGLLKVTDPGDAVTLAPPAGSSVRCALSVTISRGRLSQTGQDSLCSPLVLHHGTNVFRFSVTTRNLNCTGSERRSSSSAPECSPPPLPAGSYSLAVHWSNWANIPDPEPVSIALT